MNQRRHVKVSSESPLKKLREELNMSQEGFARQIGTSGRIISRWERGDSVPSLIGIGP
ncbi:putative transcriptional regulator [Leptolyngbya sp. PCC 7375]|nr:putative transcriptional regulator [Leptolyngbya sp. PCC 7375]